ncbi:MAG: cobalamin-independent methionine synthase II family protein [Proteobacteria bacterium]|nr:cobalamin-independent methionine synthase II family protein [Pseudomonadota bacterium]
MKRSEDRILTTHVGSLIRPDEIKQHLLAKRGDDYDADAHNKSLTKCVAEIVRQQAAAGVDVVSDGEFGKGISWSQYVIERLDGFERRFLADDEPDPYAKGADRERFAEFYAEMDAEDAKDARSDGGAVKAESYCVGPITYTGQAELQRDIDNLKDAIKAVPVTEAFLPVAAPASAIPDRRNEYYKTNEECVFALAEAMRTEYKTITDAGILVQIDDARAAVTYDRMLPTATKEEFLAWLAMHMEALNHAIKGIPAEMIRYHVCWGSWPGPHTTDVPLRDIADLVLSVNAGAYVIEGANPRHEHEWRVWEDVKLPDGKVLVPGVISHATNIVEHPELVSERIVRLAKLVGRENVLASTDCGFAQGPFHQRVHPTVMWAKLEALAEGAALATKELWG